MNLDLVLCCVFRTAINYSIWSFSAKCKQMLVLRVFPETYTRHKYTIIQYNFRLASLKEVFDTQALTSCNYAILYVEWCHAVLEHENWSVCRYDVARQHGQEWDGGEGVQNTTGVSIERRQGSEQKSVS